MVPKRETGAVSLQRDLPSLRLFYFGMHCNDISVYQTMSLQGLPVAGQGSSVDRLCRTSVLIPRVGFCRLHSSKHSQQPMVEVSLSLFWILVSTRELRDCR